MYLALQTYELFLIVHLLAYFVFLAFLFAPGDQKVSPKSSDTRGTVTQAQKNQHLHPDMMIAGTDTYKSPVQKFFVWLGPRLLKKESKIGVMVAFAGALNLESL